MKLLTVIIVTYNSQDLIEKCLENLFLHNDIGQYLEIIIVDNSVDIIGKQMFEFIEKKYSEKVILIKNSKNGGYGQGNNLGIRHAHGKYIAIMNPDIILLEPLFKYVLNSFEQDPNLGILGFKQLGGKNLSFYFRLEFYFPFLSSILTKILNYINLFLQKYMFLSGALFFVNKKEFEDIGLFDENLFLYGEESDITKRFHSKKLNVYYDKSKSYLHEIDERSEMPASTYRIFLNSCLYYRDKFSFSKDYFITSLVYELKIKKMLFFFFGKKELIKSSNEKLKIIDEIKVQEFN